jgi:glutamate synthase domain-containing protein 3
MTGGTVVVLGKTGRNFAAGMSGGMAYVYDEDGQFARRCNTAMVALERVLHAEEQRATQDEHSLHRDAEGKPVTDEALLRRLIEAHHRWTGSLRAREILDGWGECRARFVKVFPSEYRRALAEMKAKQALDSQVDATIARARAAEPKASPTVPAK